MSSKNVYDALFSFWNEVGAVGKTQTAKEEKFSYKYADLSTVLSSIKEPLKKNELLLVQSVEIVDGREKLITRLVHLPSKEEIKSEMLMPATMGMRETGANLTYLRRYSIITLLCLATDEDIDCQADKDNKADRYSSTDAEKSALKALCRGDIGLLVKLDENIRSMTNGGREKLKGEDAAKLKKGLEAYWRERDAN